MSGRNNIYETENVKSVNRRDSGFTLIETVIALLVLTIGLLGTAALAISVMQGNNDSRQISTATALAQDKMEEIRGLGYQGVIDNDPSGTESIEVDSHTYRRDVVMNVDSPAQFMNTLTVTVYWDLDDLSHNRVENKMVISR